MEMELVRWITTVFREIDDEAINAVMKGKLSQGEHQVRHVKWEDLKGEKSTNGNVLEFSICQVEDPYDAVHLPVGNIVLPNLSVSWPRIVLVRGKAER